MASRVPMIQKVHRDPRHITVHLRFGVSLFSANFAFKVDPVVDEGRSLELCRTHTATVVAAMPETFDDLRALFVGITPLDAAGPRHVPERRSPIERRAEENRRMFPPRPEGRRRGEGRRASDPRGL